MTATASRSRTRRPPSRPRQGPSKGRWAELQSLLIADEPHHIGELAAVGPLEQQDAFHHARFRLLLSATPFKSDNTPNPWWSYGDDGISSADYAYGYTEALMTMSADF